MANTYRKLCADAIEKNGGYSRGYHERFALEWNVEVNAYGRSTFAELLPLAKERLKEDYGISKLRASDEALQEVAGQWDADMERGQLFYAIVEDMARSVTDDDTYRTIRPEIATRYGLPVQRFPRKYARITDEGCYYPAAKSHWQLVDPWLLPEYDVKWEFHGRGGKHLCLAEFEGRSLDCTSEALAVQICEDDDGSHGNTWCQNLLAFIHECDLCFTPENVKREWEHQASWRLMQELEEIHCEVDESELVMGEVD